MKRTQYIISHGDISESRAIKLIDLCFDAVAKSYNEIYLAISSLGGSTHSGIALFNYLKALPITLTTHNLGTVDSASVVVFLAGQNRFACKDSRFLIMNLRIASKTIEKRCLTLSITKHLLQRTILTNGLFRAKSFHPIRP
jgi:ATP-dependent protease ClpP protease subunit